MSDRRDVSAANAASVNDPGLDYAYAVETLRRYEDVLRQIVEECSYASGGNYAPDVARWAKEALDA